MMGLCLWRAPRSPAGFAAATAVTYVTFFALNKQAFCNYYFFVVGALCCGVASADDEPDMMANKGRNTDEPVVRSRP